MLARKECFTGIYDGSLVMGNLMLAAYSLGLGSIWIHRAKEEFEREEGLELLKSLGVDAIWFTGIPRHSSGQVFVKGTAGSPYSISDYHDVNPYLADDSGRRMEEFGALVGRVHQAGFRFIMDYVPNHVAPGCKDVPTLDRYDFDWDDTRKIDYSAPGAWESMLEIALFWASQGVDGLRCDMVELVPPQFMQWLIASIREKYPEVIFVAEVYEKDKYRLSQKSGNGTPRSSS